MTWSPEQYERFKSERKQPFLDLFSLVEKRPRMRVVDLGCGTGELTRELHEALAAEETLGIDNSETMLLKAGSFGGEMLHFENGDIEAFVTDKPYDLIISNAALHWVPDHEQLFHRLTRFLSVDGQLAVQMPDNDDHPSHAVAARVASRFGIEPRPVTCLPSRATRSSCITSASRISTSACRSTVTCFPPRTMSWSGYAAHCSRITKRCCRPIDTKSS